jgi:hypothetical protein
MFQEVCVSCRGGIGYVNLVGSWYNVQREISISFRSMWQRSSRERLVIHNVISHVSGRQLRFPDFHADSDMSERLKSEHNRSPDRPETQGKVEGCDLASKERLVIIQHGGKYSVPTL